MLNTLDVDVLTFETCANAGRDLEAIGNAITDTKIAIGVVDTAIRRWKRPKRWPR